MGQSAFFIKKCTDKTSSGAEKARRSSACNCVQNQGAILVRPDPDPVDAGHPGRLNGTQLHPEPLYVPAPLEPVTKPLLVFDGDCGFCVYSVLYAETLAGSAVDFAPYQAVAHDRREFTEDEYRASIRLFQPGFEPRSGAHAAFTVLALGGLMFWLWCYRRLPGFDTAAEVAYRWVAAHRSLCLTVARVLFGSELRPTRLTNTISWLLAGLGLVYTFAFLSLALQINGLVGSEGILPAAPYLQAVHRQLGADSWLALPSLFWLNASDATLQAACWLGVAAGLALAAGIRPAWSAFVAWLLYLSLVGIGQVFLRFQWDILLLEAGFLAMFLRSSPLLVTWLYRLLLFRFILQSGLVKLLSSDSAWWDLTALYYHFETQPLPTVLAWYAHNLPAPALKAGVGFTFFVELLVPFLLLMPRRPRFLGALFVVALEVLILLTGSYNFFNLLTIVLCLALIDDRRLPALRWFPAPTRNWLTHTAKPVATMHILLGLILVWGTGNFARLPETVRTAVRMVAPFHFANSYGPFEVMTEERREVMFEGSEDGTNWKPYRLRYNPAEPARFPRVATPMQPRLDWQLWFAALGDIHLNRWVQAVAAGLLSGSEPITGLFRDNPFEKSPPQYVRAVSRSYEFTTPTERAATGAWWKVGEPQVYLRPMQLRRAP